MTRVFEPRLIFQGAFCIDVAGKLHSLMQTGLSSAFCFIPVNSHELDNRQGLEKALDYAREHLLPGYANYVASEIGTEDDFYNIHGASKKELRQTPLDYEHFQQAGHEQKHSISLQLFADKLDAIQKNPDSLEELQAQRERHIKLHPGKILCIGLDKMRNMLFYNSSCLKAAPLKTVTTHYLPLFTAVGLAAWHAPHMLVQIPHASEILPYVAEALPYIVGGGFVTGSALTITPLSGKARHWLTSHPPVEKRHKKLTENITRQIDEHLSPEAQKILSAYSPIILIGADMDYFDPEHIAVNPGLERFLQLLAGYQDSNSGSIWIQTAASSFPATLLEELEHRVNDVVEFDNEEWSNAVSNDRKLASARKFIRKSFEKTGIFLVYNKESHGAEILVELGVYYDKQRAKGLMHEEILAVIEEKLPHAGALFRKYKSDEAKLLAAIDQESLPEPVMKHEDRGDSHFTKMLDKRKIDGRIQSDGESQRGYGHG